MSCPVWPVYPAGGPAPETVVAPAPDPVVDRLAVDDAPCESYTTDAAL